MEVPNNFKDLRKLGVRNIVQYSAANVSFPAFLFFTPTFTSSMFTGRELSLALVPFSYIRMIVKLTYWRQHKPRDLLEAHIFVLPSLLCAQILQTRLPCARIYQKAFGFCLKEKYNPEELMYLAQGSLSWCITNVTSGKTKIHSVVEGQWFSINYWRGSIVCNVFFILSTSLSHSMLCLSVLPPSPSVSVLPSLSVCLCFSVSACLFFRLSLSVCLCFPVSSVSLSVSAVLPSVCLISVSLSISVFRLCLSLLFCRLSLCLSSLFLYLYLFSVSVSLCCFAVCLSVSHLYFSIYICFSSLSPCLSLFFSIRLSVCARLCFAVSVDLVSFLSPLSLSLSLFFCLFVCFSVSVSLSVSVLPSLSVFVFFLSVFLLEFPFTLHLTDSFCSELQDAALLVVDSAKSEPRLANGKVIHKPRNQIIDTTEGLGIHGNWTHQ